MKNSLKLEATHLIIPPARHLGDQPARNRCLTGSWQGVPLGLLSRGLANFLPPTPGHRWLVEVPLKDFQEVQRRIEIDFPVIELKNSPAGVFSRPVISIEDHQPLGQNPLAVHHDMHLEEIPRVLQGPGISF